MRADLGGIGAALGLVPVTELRFAGALPSCFAVTELSGASVAAVGDAVAALCAGLGLPVGSGAVDARLAALWFDRSIAPEGWSLPPIWDALAGDYPAKGGWIRLHTNLPHHRDAALSVLGCAARREAVAEALRGWDPHELEGRIAAAGGVSAAMRDRAAWAAHPQGAAVAAEPLVGFGDTREVAPRDWGGAPGRPLAGLRVLDLTRVLAGPVCTRGLAGVGAEVLRIDPPGWDEPNVVPDITLGKRCARLDLRVAEDRAVFDGLLAQADVLVHGYRPGALEGLGLGDAARAGIAPRAVDAALCAYGWTGPWAGRRGFDSLVQMSAGIAAEGQARAGAEKPVPLPVQALDHATGYLMAAAVVGELARGRAGQGLRPLRLSLARTAELLAGMTPGVQGAMAAATPADYADGVERTVWGVARRLRPALEIDGVPMHWERPAAALGSSAPVWP
ncbi:CoA transferase [Oceaniglobus roseus]|uniref:CoA transferase n=1 Tax=Oceaniglobus roseus TaxID=1737570 RepID=UPI000C7EE8EC|nr:CoA transferase [Kandeliimicrobium roseum]